MSCQAVWGLDHKTAKSKTSVKVRPLNFSFLLVGHLSHRGGRTEQPAAPGARRQPYLPRGPEDPAPRASGAARGGAWPCGSCLSPVPTRPASCVGDVPGLVPPPSVPGVCRFRLFDSAF